MATNAAVRTVAVVGTGVIGASWASLFLSRGLRVIASDPAPGAEQRLRSFIDNAWPSLQALGNGRTDVNASSSGSHPQGNLPQQSQSSALETTPPHKSLQFVDRLEDHLGEVDYVQENGPEKLEYKESVFALLDRKTPRHAVLASSSSGLPSSKYLAKCESKGERILVGHPFNPPHLIPAVEVVPHSNTSEDSIQQAMEFYRLLDRRPIRLNEECPGFVANRLQAALVHEAYSLVSRGLVSSSDIDAVVSDALALRWAIQGPFLTKVLGGGGGMDGFKKHLAHVGAAATEWAQDMQKHAWQFEEGGKNVLKMEVDRQLASLGEAGVKALPIQRDSFIVETLKLKKSMTA